MFTSIESILSDHAVFKLVVLGVTKEEIKEPKKEKESSPDIKPEKFALNNWCTWSKNSTCPGLAQNKSHFCQPISMTMRGKYNYSLFQRNYISFCVILLGFIANIL